TLAQAGGAEEQRAARRPLERQVDPVLGEAVGPHPILVEDVARTIRVVLLDPEEELALALDLETERVDRRVLPPFGAAQRVEVGIEDHLAELPEPPALAAELEARQR